MAKTFMGVRLRSLREERGITQAALAQALKLSPSYVNQIESNQRPITVAVLLRLQGYFGIDLQFFSEDEESRVIAELREITAGVLGPGAVPLAELQSVAQQLPAFSKVLLALQRRAQHAEDRVASLAAGSDGDRFAADAGVPVQPHEAVREFFYARHNHLAVLDERAEAMYEGLMAEAPVAGRALPAAGADRPAAQAGLGALIEQRLLAEHGVRTLSEDPDPANRQVIRHYDPQSRILRISPSIEPGQRTFQLAIQAALLTVGTLIDSFIDAAAFSQAEARALARIGFANHFAGALLLPYGRFLAAAEALRYDIDLLSEQFGVSFESVCHRLSTMQRADARRIPFFFVRVDRAGNISKRQSATDFHFSRTGGTCPLWNVYEAFAQPGKVITQLSRMPDNRTTLWVARTVAHQRGGYGSLRRTFAVALGCDVRYASRLVYSKGIALDDPEAATPIGAGCKVCDREDCAQRAFPALGGHLRIDENVRQFAPYSGSPSPSE